LYQKTQARLHQQIIELPKQIHPSVIGKELVTADLCQWVKKDSVLALLDRPNEDYIVIPKQKLQDLIDFLKERESDIEQDIEDFGKLQDIKKQLLGLPNKKEK